MIKEKKFKLNEEELNSKMKKSVDPVKDSKFIETMKILGKR